MVTEALAALVADEGARLARLDLGDFGSGLFLVLVLVGLGSLELVERLVLVVLEPLEGALDWVRVSEWTRVLLWVGGTHGLGCA